MHHGAQATGVNVLCTPQPWPKPGPMRQIRGGSVLVSTWQVLQPPLPMGMPVCREQAWRHICYCLRVNDDAALPGRNEMQRPRAE
jgi:hypothetical protein